MYYDTGIIAENLKNMLIKFGYRNGYDVKRSRPENDPYGDKDLDLLPTHNTIDAFLNQRVKKPKTVTIRAFAEFYNKKFHANITDEDFGTKLLPCKAETVTRLPKLYEGFYYCYFISKIEEKSRYCLMNIYQEDYQYKVRALMGLADEETLRCQTLVDYLKDTSAKFAELQELIPELPPMENYYTYFEGELEWKDDYCLINLHRPEDYPFHSSKNNFSIILRRYAEDMRIHMTAAIGMMANTGYNRNLYFQKILMGKKLFSSKDEIIEKILNSPGMTITDEEDLAWYIYNKQ